MASKKDKEKRAERRRQDNYRRDMQLRGARGTRLLPVRIMSAAVLCLDLYWLFWMGATDQGIVLSGLLPLACALADAAGVIEQSHMMSYGVKRLKWTELGVEASAVLYLVAAGITLVAGKDVLFFYYADALFAYITLAVGIGARAFLFYRLYLISTNTDKQYALYRKVVDGEYKY